MCKNAEILQYLINMEKENLAVCKNFYDFDTKIENLEIIRKAILNSTVLKGKYHDKLREIEPLGIVFKEKIYLIAREKEKGNGIYTYNLSKFNTLETTEKSFDGKNFNLKEYAGESIGIYHDEIIEIKLKFSPKIRERIQNFKFGKNPKEEILEDNSTVITFRSGGKIELFRLIFKWGKEVEIIAPNSLKEDYKNYLGEILNLY